MRVKTANAILKDYLKGLNYVLRVDSLTGHEVRLQDVEIGALNGELNLLLKNKYAKKGYLNKVYLV